MIAVAISDTDAGPPGPDERRPTPPWRRTGARLSVVVVALFLHGVGFWVLWHSLLTDAYGRPGFGSAIKDFYLGDQYAYLGIASNVEHGRSAYVEPYTATGSSIYPSGYFWLLGQVARTTGTTVFGAWNGVGMAVDVALFAVAGGFAWSMTRSRWAWVLGPIPVLIGTFQYWTIGAWRTIYGAHAVLWPAAASLFSPGAEPAALLLSGVALALLVLHERQTGRWPLALAGGSGVASALTLHVHTYVAIFTATAVALWFLTRSWQIAVGAGRTRVRLAALVAAAAVAVAIVPDSIPILRVAIVIVTGLAAAPIGGAALRRLLPPLAALCLGAAVVATPMLLRVGSQVGDRSSFLYLRQASGVATDLSLPLPQVVFHSAPALLLTAGCLLHLRRRRTAGGAGAADEPWAAALVALFLAAALLVFNEDWGLQQEPYRFLPYAHVLLATFALPWLVDRPSGTVPRALVTRVVAVAVLAASVPTTLLLGRQTPAIVQSPAAEQDALRAVASALPDDGLAMLDRCLPRGAFKALTGAAVVGMNAGLAYPAGADAVRTVLGLQAEGTLADGLLLDRAEVTSFVTMDRCSGPRPDQLAARFGPPTHRVQLSPPAPCGLPPLELQVYRRDIGESGTALRWTAAPAEPGSPAHPFAPCLLSNRAPDVA